MRSSPLSNLKQGINRLRVKGGANPASLYDLVNGWIQVDGSVKQREGTIRAQTLNSSTHGLMADNGIFNVFSITQQSVPAGYQDNILINPVNPALDISTIWFAKPFMGFPYVVAQFTDGSIYHYWLQNSGNWTANTIYKTGTLILPNTPTGFAYLAQRISPVNPTWQPGTAIALNAIIEPTEYTGFQYKAVAVAGSSPHTGQSEPVWPIVAAATLQEFGDFDTSSTDAGTTQTTGTGGQPLSSTITDRYGDSTTIASAGASSGGTLTLPTTASTTVTTWVKGTIYAPGAVVKPSTSQGAFLNAIPNGDFEAGNDGNWVLGSGVIFNNTNMYQGVECLQFTASHADVTATMNTFGTVTPGQSVTATAYLNPNNAGANLSMGVNLRWYDSSDTFLSATAGPREEGSGYRLSTVTGVAPANAAHVRVQLDAGNNTSSHTGYADLVSWSLATPAAVSNFLFEAVQSSTGTSGSTEPTWPTVLGNTVVDNTVTWKALGTSIITWEAIPIMQSGGVEPTWPTAVPIAVHDTSSFTDQNGHTIDTSISWLTSSRQITDKKCPNTNSAALNSSHVFAIDKDIVDFSAAVDPTDWSSANNAGYLPTGLNNYGDNPAAVLALYRSNLMVFNSGGYQMWQTDPDPANMALLDAQPVGSIYPRACQSVANDLLFLTEVGVRNLATVGATANMQVGSSGQPVDALVLAQQNAPPNNVIAMTSNSPSGGIAGYSNGDIVAYGTPAYGSVAPATYQGFPIGLLGWTFGSAGNSNIRIALQYTGTPPPDSLIGSLNFTADSSVVFNLGASGLTTSLVSGASGNTYKVWQWHGVGVLPEQTQPFTNGNVYNMTIGQVFVQYTPISLYYPGRGQYWLFFGPQAFVFTVNGQGLRTWSRYVFPDTITDWTLNAGILYLRTAGNLVWQLDANTLVDDAGGNNTQFIGIMQWPYVDVGPLGINKELIGVDLVGSGQASIQIGWNQNDPTTFNDNPGFSGSLNVTPPYTVAVAETVPGQPIPIPMVSPSFTLILTFAGGQAWSWQAANLYLQDQTGGGATS